MGGSQAAKHPTCRKHQYGWWEGPSSMNPGSPLLEGMECGRGWWEVTAGGLQLSASCPET